EHDPIVPYKDACALYSVLRDENQSNMFVYLVSCKSGRHVGLAREAGSLVKDILHNHHINYSTTLKSLDDRDKKELSCCQPKVKKEWEQHRRYLDAVYNWHRRLFHMYNNVRVSYLAFVRTLSAWCVAGKKYVAFSFGIQ
ncbi:MAG: hypothetical protein WBQ73_03100, partial [Candidatus Babeliales bacterium]